MEGARSACHCKLIRTVHLQAGPTVGAFSSVMGNGRANHLEKNTKIHNSLRAIYILYFAFNIKREKSCFKAY